MAIPTGRERMRERVWKRRERRIWGEREKDSDKGETERHWHLVVWKKNMYEQNNDGSWVNCSMYLKMRPPQIYLSRKSLPAILEDIWGKKCNQCYTERGNTGRPHTLSIIRTESHVMFRLFVEFKTFKCNLESKSIPILRFANATHLLIFHSMLAKSSIFMFEFHQRL
jgi:hypothetical protein